MQLLEVLEEMSVYGVGSDGIITTRTLDHASSQHSVTKKEGILLHYSDCKLKLYLPVDQSEMQIAYSYYLPKELLAFLKLSDK